jgi:pyruvate/2-oxoglutarate/acetoin dehydrogenase E1 component
VDEAPLRCSAASEIAATVAARAFHDLKAPIARVTRADVPVPYSPALEQALTPDADDIVTAIRGVLSGGAAAPAK